jgi:histidyl-tRNA synthetase
LAEKAEAVLRVLDKLSKQGRETALAELTSVATDRGVGLTTEQAGRVLDLAGMTGSNADVLDRVERDFGRNPKAAEGVARLRELFAVASTAGIPDGRLSIDLSICRGLDYYTGTIYETFLTDLPGIGSVCAGGRYDNLASLYTKQVLPGVGASLGLDRLLTAMEELKLLPKASTPAPVLVVQFAAERLGDYQRIARELRRAGVATEIYPEAKKIGPQLQYAERRGFRLALIAGPDEFAQGVCKIKVLASRTEHSVPEAELVPTVRRLLDS